MICPYCAVAIDAPMAHEWRFQLPGVVVRSANAAPGYQSRGRGALRRYHADREAALLAAQWAMRVHGIPRADRLRYVILTRVYSGRQRAYDVRNLHDKPIVDAMVKAGLLVDDSPDWCRVWAHQRRGEASATECRLLEPA